MGIYGSMLPLARRTLFQPACYKMYYETSALTKLFHGDVHVHLHKDDILELNTLHIYFQTSEISQQGYILSMNGSFLKS